MEDRIDASAIIEALINEKTQEGRDAILSKLSLEEIFEVLVFFGRM